VGVCNHVEGVVAAPNWPFHGPLAHGFACGAHIPTHVSSPWNALDDPVASYQENRESLSDSWGVESEQDWHRQVGYLLAGENIGTESEAVLHQRRALIRQRGGWDLPSWQEAVRRWCRWRKTPDEETAEQVELAGVISRYEVRFRTDGLLVPNAIVTSMLGYDFGRAVNLARWGFGGRFCDQRTAESVVLRAGQLARQHYSSWPDFSAGYALGRVVRFDGEEYGHMYVSVRGPHQLLMASPHSPWWHIPFH